MSIDFFLEGNLEIERFESCRVAILEGGAAVVSSIYFDVIIHLEGDVLDKEN